MKRLGIILGIISALSCAAFPQCSPSQYDMKQWIAMSPALAKVYHLSGNANPHYDVEGSQKGTSYLVSVKGSAGYPWDIDTYDGNFVYQWITENTWSDPTTFKAFNTPLEWAPRCINIPSEAGKLSSLPQLNPAYTFYGTGCVKGQTDNLGNTVTEVWGPYSNPGYFPANADYLALAYRYSCDSSYDNCQFKEEFDYQQDFGLVQWTLFELVNGSYEQQQQSQFTVIQAGGSPTVDFPCPLP